MPLALQIMVGVVVTMVMVLPVSVITASIHRFWKTLDEITTAIGILEVDRDKLIRDVAAAHQKIRELEGKHNGP
jgi:hypothetical protein